MVTIYDYDIAKELFSREDLTGRPNNFAYRNRMLGEKQGTSFLLADKNGLFLTKLMAKSEKILNNNYVVV